jgi:hypothetical protein
MNKFGSLFGAAILALASMPANAVLIPFTDPVLWETAAGEFLTETFENAITSDPTIRFDSGIVSEAATASSILNAVGPLGTPPDDRFQLAAYYGRVGGSSGSTEITWAFPDPVLGFFGYIDGLIVGDVLKVTVLGDEFFVSENGGFGVLGDDLDSDLFSDVVWESATDMSLSFTIGVGMDDFSYTGFSYTGTDPGSPVPAPPALWLFVAGLLGLIGFKRRSKAA